jgi:hypothetical protein
VFVGCDADGDGIQGFFDACPTQAGAGNGCPAAVVTPITPVTPKKCKKGFKLKKGKCKRKRRKK